MTEQKDKDGKAAKEDPKKKDVNGYLLILAAFGLFWLGSYFRVPTPIEGKMIVAQEGIDPRFEKTVVFILRHNPGGAYGVIINKPGDAAGEGHGGPVEIDQSMAIYTNDVSLPSGYVLGHTGFAFVRGVAVEELEKVSPKPDWSRVYKGYAGWGRKQLDREVKKGSWQVIDFDEKLLTETQMDQKWEEAQKAVEANAEPEEKKETQQTM